MNNTRKIQLIVLSTVILAILAFIGKTLAVIPAGTAAVTELFGQISPKPLKPGVHLINPLSKLVKFSTRLKDVKEVVSTTSKEGLTLDLDVSLQYKVDPEKLGDIYKNLGSDPEEIIISRFRSLIREITAQYELTAIYGEKRQEVAQILSQKLEQELQPLGFMVDKALLRKVVLPENMQAAIQEKLAAEQESQKLDFEIAKARKEAEKQKIEAQSQAEAQRILAEGLTPEILQLKAIEATADIAQSNNAKIVIVGGSEQQLPLVIPGQ